MIDAGKPHSWHFFIIWFCHRSLSKDFEKSLIRKSSFLEKNKWFPGLHEKKRYITALLSPKTEKEEKSFTGSLCILTKACKNQSEHETSRPINTASPSYALIPRARQTVAPLPDEVLIGLVLTDILCFHRCVQFIMQSKVKARVPLLSLGC